MNSHPLESTGDSSCVELLVPVPTPLTSLRTQRAYPDGSIFDGYAHHSYINIYSFVLVCRYLNSAGFREGQGRLKNRRGDIYVGNWEADKRSGFGIYEWKNGDCYRGDWKVI